MRHRIFIAINLPENIKNKLITYQDNWPDLPIRWTKKENLHITLVFLGSVADDGIPEMLKVVEQVTQKHNPFFIDLNQICYGPPKKMPPRMVWATGKSSKELSQLYGDLQHSLLDSYLKDSIKTEKRSYSLHITLGRIRSWDFKRINPEERPIIKENINFNFTANSIEVMESYLKRGGAQYAILKSFPLTV